MLGIKPLLIVEDGEIVPLEKVKSRGKAVERLYEFITEFPSIEKITVLHGTDGTDLPELLHRLEMAFPKLEVGVTQYGPVLATHVGPDALGIFVFESLRWGSEAIP
jgi:fatty acid-binding protein DegV